MDDSVLLPADIVTEKGKKLRTDDPAPKTRKPDDSNAPSRETTEMLKPSDGSPRTFTTGSPMPFEDLLGDPGPPPSTTSPAEPTAQEEVKPTRLFDSNATLAILGVAVAGAVIVGARQLVTAVLIGAGLAALIWAIRGRHRGLSRWLGGFSGGVALAVAAGLIGTAGTSPAGGAGSAPAGTTTTEPQTTSPRLSVETPGPSVTPSGLSTSPSETQSTALIEVVLDDLLPVTLEGMKKGDVREAFNGQFRVALGTNYGSFVSLNLATSYEECSALPDLGRSTRVQLAPDAWFKVTLLKLNSSDGATLRITKEVGDIPPVVSKNCN